MRRFGTGTFALAAGAVALAALAATLAAPRLGALGGGPADALAPCRGGQVAGDVGGPFALVDAQGREVTDRDVFTAPSVLYFGYTFCPDICPLDMARNAAAVEILEARGVAATPVFVSIDPARDTPEAVGDFAAAFHPRAVGLTGSDAQVRAASQAFRTYFRKQEGDPDYYLMDHSTLSYLVLPGVGFVDFVDRDESPEAVADRLQCFAEAAGA